VIDDAQDGDLALSLADPTHLVAIAHEEIAAGDPGHVHIINKFTLDLASMEIVREQAVFNASTEHAGIQSVITGGNQVVATWNGRNDLLGVELPSQGPPVWDDNVSEILPNAFSLGFLVVRGQSVLVNVAGSHGSAVVTVDACGVTQPAGFANLGAPPMFFADGNAVLQLAPDLTPQSSSLVIARTSGGSTEPNCHFAVQLGDNRFACMHLFDDARIAVFDGDGSSRNERALPTVENGETLGFSGTMVAAADGFLLALATAQVASGEVIGNRLFIFHDEPGLPEVASTLLLLTPAGNAFTGIDAPLVDASGVVLVSALGRIFAFQTALRGLAPVAYPRGPVLGGNDARGEQATN
jgi:hypothetical protein